MPVTTDLRKPNLAVHSAGEGLLRLELAGDWLTRRDLPRFPALEAEAQAVGGVKAVAFDTSQLGEWNSALVSFVFKCQEYCARQQWQLRTEGLPEGLLKLLHLANAVPEKKDAARHIPTPPFFQALGESTLALREGAWDMLTFVGESIIAFSKLLRGKAQFRWSDTFVVTQECGPRAIGIVALINLLMGLILAFVGATQLTRFGASIYTADLVAIASVREIGCIMTAIIMCGRTGAAFAAQLGTMKVNQEIEALQTFGVNPVEFLVLPRMLALIFMMPLLVVFADLVSIIGGYIVSTSILDITSSLYISRTIESITLKSFLLGIVKGGYFGVVVAITGCLRGMQCGNNAAAVGLATTSAVVTGITTIIASDGLFAILCNALGI